MSSSHTGFLKRYGLENLSSSLMSACFSTGQALCSDSHVADYSIEQQTAWQPVRGFLITQIFQPCCFTANAIIAGFSKL